MKDTQHQRDGNSPHEPRIIVRVELTEVARDAVTADCDRNGMTQLAMLSRVVEWFAGQSATVRADVLGMLGPAAAADTGRKVIEAMVGGKPTPPRG